MNLQEINKTLSFFNPRLKSLKSQLIKVRQKIAELNKEKIPLLQNENFIYKGVSYPIKYIVLRPSWYFDSDPYNGGCYRIDRNYLELWQNYHSVPDFRESEESSIYAAISSEFYKQFEINIKEVARFVDDGPPKY